MGAVSTDAPHILVEDDGPIRTITLNRPEERNAQLPSMWATLADLADNLPGTCRVVVLRGAGVCFSAGLDLRMMNPAGIDGEPNIMAMAMRGASGELADSIAEMQRGFTAWQACPAVVIAAVQGYAIGAGFQLALGADLRVVAHDVRFAMKESSLGLVPDLAGTSPLVRLVGYARALEICATGRYVGADEAVAIGLANIAVPRPELETATRELAEGIMAAPDKAIRELKPLLRHAIDTPLSEQVRLEREAQARRLVSLVSGTG